ncbi:MAG: OB-fold nucleic acid binding domain-containing protein, partial [Pseudomonadota bacterium]
FTAGEADQLRRAMAAWKRRGGLGPFEGKLIRGMRQRGYTEEFASAVFRQIKGFGEYGFPESHAASFALLVYVSCWLKCYEPAAFTCALINSQPMGFYPPSQLVQNARRHDVEVRPVDVRLSVWDCTLERMHSGEPALRLGLRLVKGLAEETAQRLVAARAEAEFLSTQDLAERAQLDRGDLGALAAAGALESLAGHRHRARWEVAGVEQPMPLMPRVDIREATPLLSKPTEGEDVIADYNSTGLTLGKHPVALVREQLDAFRFRKAEELQDCRDGIPVRVAGLVITRQRPATAGGVTFVTLEDESGHVNLVVWERIAERQRRILTGARLMGVAGTLQHQDGVIHVVAAHLQDHSALLGTLITRARDFH